MVDLWHDRSLLFSANAMSTMGFFAVFCAALPGNALVTPVSYGALIYTIPAEAWGAWGTAAGALACAGLYRRRRWMLAAGSAGNLGVFALFFAAGAGSQAEAPWAFSFAGAVIWGAWPLCRIARQFFPAPLEGRAALAVEDVAAPLLLTGAVTALIWWVIDGFGWQA